ncbi:MAG: hypothetical protein IGS38_04925 [Synechococcales cyanobacterium M58_A2018_015]|nr:hypothetical protein [Synechococcales cyanobacterium M58_A2018_015]
MKTIVNLTIPAIVEAIETVLSEEPYCSHPQIAAIPNLREELITYVLHRVRSRYRVVDSKDKISVVFRSLTISPEEKQSIEAAVYQGIRDLTQAFEHSVLSFAAQSSAEAYLTPLR